jgi:uncharacterized protein (TIGR02453 family)
VTRGEAHFGPEFFLFFRDLGRNNNREWFLKNKPRYESDVRDKLLSFVADFAPHLRKISVHYLADPRPSGGSLTRINRDMRFSKDKSPYKTMAGALFRHEQGKAVPAPAFFLHLEPGRSFVGIGVHAPDPPTLGKIRQEIVRNPEGWNAAISGKKFRSSCVLMNESLTGPPRGYPSDHPCIVDLKRKHYCTQTFFTDREVCAPGFLGRFADTCTAAADFMAYLTNAVGLPW